MRLRQQPRRQLGLGFLSDRIGGRGFFWRIECCKVVGGDENLVDPSTLPRSLMSSGFQWEVCHEFGWLKKIDRNFIRTTERSMTDLDL